VAKKDVSVFDEILTKFSSDEDRTAYQGIAERNEWLKDYGLRQSDYSRFMDENGAKLRQLESWDQWRANNWDDGHRMTKAEVAKDEELTRLKQEKETLERQIALGGGLGDDMTFEELEGKLGEWTKKAGLVDQAAFAAKEREVRDFVTGVNQWTAKAALTVPFLNQKHLQEFGELFEPDKFLQEATEKQRWDLKDYYEKDFVVAKREAQRTAKHEAELAKVKADSEAAIAKATADAEKKISQLQGMGPQGMNPSDAEGPMMGHFQKEYLKLNQETTKVPDGAIVGEGTLAAIAARERRENLANR